MRHRLLSRKQRVAKQAAFFAFAALFLVGCGAVPVREAQLTDALPLALTDELDSYNVGRYLSVLEDPSGELTIEDVTSPEYDTQFEPSRVDVPNLGYSDSAFWVRLPLANQSELTNRWLLDLSFPNLQYVDLYTPRPGGDGYDAKQTGAFRPVSTRDVRHEHFVFDLQVPEGSRDTYYLRVNGGASITLPLTLYTPDAFAVHLQVGLVLRSLFVGALLGLLAYNVFLFFSIRERSYLYLVLLLISMIVFEAIYSGYTEAYLIPNLYYLKGFYQPASFFLLLASMLLFADTFLELKSRAPRLHRISMALMAGWGVLLLFIPFLSYYQLAVAAMPYGVISTATILAAGLLAWKRQFPYARYFEMAWFGLLVAFLMALLVRLGTMPSTLFSEHAYQAGMVWMAICLSLALADRINVLRTNLQSSEFRLSQILHGLPLGVVVYGTDARPTFANKRVTEILSNPQRGIVPDLSARRTLADAMELFSFRVAGRDEKYPLERFPVQRALRGEPAAADDIEADLIDRRVPIEIWANPVIDEFGKVESALVAFQDISERHKAQAQLEEYRLHLEDLVEQRTTELSEINILLNHEIAERQLLSAVQLRLVSWLSSVNETQYLLGGTARLPEVQERLLVDVRRFTGALSAFVGVFDPPTDQIVIVSCLANQGTQVTRERASVQCGVDLMLRDMLQEDEVVVFDKTQLDEGILDTFSTCLDDPNIVSVVLVPARGDDSVPGVLGLGMSRPAASLAQEEIALFRRMGTDLVGLKTYARLYETARELAATEERNRLARDLHDSVTQVLFSASLLAEVLPQIWRRDPAHGEECLEGLRRLTRGALAEMRTLLLELRPAALTKTSLEELLSQLTEAITSRAALTCRIDIERVPPVPEAIHVGFYRVAQESLNNVVKHAQAEMVDISLRVVQAPTNGAAVSSEGMKLVIADDGVGLPVTSDGAQHMGLSIMRERASAMGASLSVDSERGRGTTVTLTWPSELGSDYD